MDLSPEKFDFIRENRHLLPRKKLAKAINVPVRHVDRALRQLGDQDALRRARYRRVAKVAAFLLLVVLVGHWGRGWFAARTKARSEEEARLQDQRNRETEQRIYAVLGKREKGHDVEVTAHLKSDADSVRLAATRYLLTQGDGPGRDAALACVDDPSQRVRLATIQLMGQSQSPLVDARLASVAASKTHGLAEKSMALEGLRVRGPIRLRALAAQLLDAVSDPLPTVRKDTHALLTAAFPSAKVAFMEDTVALRAAWQAVVEVRH